MGRDKNARWQASFPNQSEGEARRGQEGRLDCDGQPDRRGGENGKKKAQKENRLADTVYDKEANP